MNLEPPGPIIKIEPGGFFFCNRKVLNRRLSRYLSSEGWLLEAFSYFYKHGLLAKAIAEKYESASIFKTLVQLSRQVKMANKNDEK